MNGREGDYGGGICALLPAHYIPNVISFCLLSKSVTSCVLKNNNEGSVKKQQRRLRVAKSFAHHTAYKFGS